MADATQFYAIRHVALDASSWTPVNTPINCNCFAIRPNADIKIRTDQGDAGTEDAILAGVQQYVLAPWIYTGARFPKGTVFAWLQSSSGPAVAVVTFVC